jgi:hypothetical protein|eukprot:COSAG06_NODE_44422_length_363_cov_1.268939_1_plen_33_part_00
MNLFDYVAFLHPGYKLTSLKAENLKKTEMCFE